MKSKYRYEIILYWSDEDEAYIAEVPELAGCAADGPTYEQALANAELVRGGEGDTMRGVSRHSPKQRGWWKFACNERAHDASAAPSVAYASGIPSQPRVNRRLEAS